MAKNITGNNQYLKEFNQAIVLELIRQHKRLSRKELSVLTGLSPTACGSITRALIKDGFLHYIFFIIKSISDNIFKLSYAV